MSTDRSTATVRALGVPDPRLAGSDALWSAQTTWVPQGPRAGRPVDQGDSDLVLTARGSRAATNTIEVRCTKAGGIDPISGAGFAWRNDGDALWRGAVAPTSIWGWDTVVYTDGTGSSGDIIATQDPHMVSTSTGTAIVAFHHTKTPSGEGVSVGRFTEASGSWSVVQVFGALAAPTNDFHPCMFIVPRASGDRVCLLYWIENPATKTLQVGLYYSDDDGATWTFGSSACLAVPLYSDEVTGLRMRAAYRNGQVVLVAQLLGAAVDAAISRDHIVQWASIDNGATFDLVANGQGAESSEGAFPDVVATGAGFVLSHVSAQSTSLAGEAFTVVRRLPDAYASFKTVPRLVTTVGLASVVTGATAAGYLQVSLGDTGSSEVRHVPAAGTVATGIITYNRGDLSLVKGENDVLYMVTSAVHQWTNTAGGSETTFAHNEVVVTRSVDFGVNWETMGNSDIFFHDVSLGGQPREKFPGSNVLWRSQDDASYLRGYAGTWWRGRLLLAHSWDANPGNEDNSLCVLAAGGYSTITLPRLDIQRNETTMAGWVLTWLPIELPGNLPSWGVSGAGSDALQNGGMRVTTSAQQRSYYNTESTIPAEGYIARIALTVDTAQALGTSQTGLILRAASALNVYSVEVTFSTTGIRVNDVYGSQVGSDVSVDTTAGVEVVVAMQGNEVALWYRARGMSDDSEYIAGPAGTLTDGGSGSSDRIEWGAFASDTSTVDWHEVHFTRDEFTGANVEVMPDMSNPGDLGAIRYSDTGVYVTDGVTLGAKSGPAMERDEHHIGVDYDFPLTRTFPAVFPSPRRGTRSTDDTAQHAIASAYDSSLLGTVESAPLSDAMCVAIMGANWRTGYVERYDVGTAAWVTVATIDTATGLSWNVGGWSRFGSSIRPEGVGIGPYTGTYLEPHELAGSTVEFASGKVRRITGNTEGTTDRTKSGRKAVVHFEGGDNTESTTTVRFWMKDFVVWWNLLGETAAGWRIRVPAQTTVDGDLRLGTVVWCNVTPFGTPYDFGRGLGQEHGVQVVEAEDRTYRTRTLAPSRRSVSVTWSEGVPTCDIEGSDPDADYLLLSDSSGALPVASAFDVPLTLRGLAEQVNGPALPVVYLPALAKGPPDSTVLNRRKDFLVGVIDGDIQLDTVRGAENSSELVRVSTVRIIEVV